MRNIRHTSELPVSFHTFLLPVVLRILPVLGFRPLGKDVIDGGDTWPPMAGGAIMAGSDRTISGLMMDVLTGLN